MPPPSPAISISAVVSAMRSALSSFHDQPHVKYSQLMVGTMEALAHAGIYGQTGDKFDQSWAGLGDKHPLAYLLMEVHLRFLTLGYIIPHPGGIGGPNYSQFHLTENGRKWVKSLAPIPEDENGFMAALNVSIPELDSIVKQYMSEAVVTYNHQTYFASAVMIGAASEKLVYMLLDALLIVTAGKERTAIEKAIRERVLPNMFDQIEKVLTSHRQSGKLPYEIHEGCQQHLLSLCEAIRVQRNDAVHPTTGEVTVTTVRLTLSAFPSVCRKIYDLIGWCQGGAKTT